MQYPIIDNLIYAYQRNGWTGLELTYGKNLVDFPDATITTSSYILFTQGYLDAGTYFFSVSIDGLSNITAASLSFRDSNDNSIVGANIVNITQGFSFTINVPVVEFRIYLQVSGPVTFYNYQIERGTEQTPYEPYAPPTTDIKNRLKLPMIHYFPHPVIDAIISAADGQHTEDEKEILRHYLTPLGIGGI